jgi:hypothetical protein
MNIPLDRLYHYIETVAEHIRGDRVVIYRFYPHGSKNINDLETPKSVDWLTKTIYPLLWCNDQEPLDHEFYKINIRPVPDHPISRPSLPIKNLNYVHNIFEKALLIHSEQRSANVEKYRQDGELIPVYYWSHALIARDWFRYAQHEQFKTNSQSTFLIYNRAWSNTREYRLKFTDQLIDAGLLVHCKTSCNAVDPESQVHYLNYRFKNKNWRPHNQLENFLTATQASSSSSADFDTDDYNNTDIEVVLETLFDDERLHLTEKSLRPIACGQPFVLAATQGSLEYLCSYGFQTFASVWDESYDQESDPAKRLAAIVRLMQTIANWSPEEKLEKLFQARAIAKHNQQWFFGQQFFDQVVTELQHNLKLAFDELDQCNNYRGWYARWKEKMSRPEVIEYLENNSQGMARVQVEQVLEMIERQLSLTKTAV